MLLIMSRRCADPANEMFCCTADVVVSCTRPHGVRHMSPLHGSTLTLSVSSCSYLELVTTRVEELGDWRWGAFLGPLVDDMEK